MKRKIKREKMIYDLYQVKEDGQRKYTQREIAKAFGVDVKVVARSIKRQTKDLTNN